MEETETLTLTVTEFIQRISKELNIEGTKGIFGNELELIALVRNCPFLYDKNLSDFKNIQKKNEAWEAIADVFAVSVGEVQNRWKGLRDTFNKYRHKVNGEDVKSPPCPYYDDMKFLEPFIIGRRPRGSCLHKSLSEQISGEEENSKILKNTGTDTTDDVSLFIECIKTLPVLYHEKYMSGLYRKQKIDAWIKVSKQFGLSAKECLARWRSLRERYSKERRLQQNGHSTRKWQFYDRLSFLDKHVKPRRKFGRNPTNNAQSKQNICFVVTSPTNSSSEAITIESSDVITAKEKKEMSTVEDVEFFDISSNMTTNSNPLFDEEDEGDDIENSQVDSSLNRASPDEDDLFGQSIAAELKLIACARKKIKLKADIYRLLYENSCE